MKLILKSPQNVLNLILKSPQIVMKLILKSPRFCPIWCESDPNSMPNLTSLALSDQAYHIGSYSCEIKQIELTYYLKINLITLPPVNEQVITIQSLDKPTHLLLCNNLALIQGCLMCLQSRTTGRNVLKTGLKKSQFFPFGDILTNLYTTLTPLN